MRTALVFGFSFFVALVFGQNADSLAAAAQVDSLIKISRDFTAKGAFDEAFEVNAAAEKIALEKFGRVSAAYGSCCFNRGRVLYFKPDYLEAEKWYLESIAIREKALGKEHLDYAISLTNLGRLYKDMGNYEKAELFFLEAKAIWEKVGGKEHPDYAISLTNLGRLYRDIGQYEKAEPFFLEFKAIWEKVGGKEHPNYAGSLIELGRLYTNMGNYEKAEPLLLESKAIVEKVLGREHRNYQIILGRLAALYVDMGNYEKAELLYLENLAIGEKTVGKENAGYAGSLQNLGILYLYMGNYKMAEPLYLESKVILEKVLGKEHPDYAKSLHNLAVLYIKMGNHEKAELLYLEAKAIQEKVLGKEHPDYATSLGNLADLYMGMGNYKRAEPLCLEAKAILEKVLGKEHPDYAATLSNLANLYNYQGDYEKAEPLYLEVKAIQEKVLGKEHPNYANNLNNLRDLYSTMGNYEKAEPLQKEYFDCFQTRLIQSATFLSEQELSNYIAAFQTNGDALSSLMLNGQNKNTPIAALSSLSYDNALFNKGFLLNASGQINRLAHTDPVSTEKFNQLKSYRRLLAAEYSKPVNERKGLADLEEKANITEKELARIASGYGEASKQVKWQQVQTALKGAEAAIEFIHFKVNFPNNTDSTMYAALLLRPGAAQPAFIPLFEEKSLDSLLHTSGDRRADYVNGLYTLADRGAKPLGKPQKTLYELLWQPLEKELAGIKTIYFSPSGLLHRLNLAAIPIGLDSVLADRYNLVEIGSTRQLVIPAEVKPAANDALLFGGIQYDSDSTTMFLTNTGLDSVSIASRGELSFSYTDSTLRIGTWNALPFTDREVTSVEKTLKTAGFQSETRRGFSATEEAFKTIGAGGKPSPRVLHLATHGFFFPDPKNSPSPLERGLGGEAEPVFKMSDHPMIRSGLLLAGANHAWATGKPLREGMEDGILTAYEISQMNLANTELVVLSACETGLGDIQGNEGVYGLQRAFKIAGAKYLIMSLWQVDDQATMKFMEVFYRKWLEGKMPIPEAFRATQAEMRERFLNPYLWAGFVLVE